ncbi:MULTISPECIES: hypothetical protein [unclassified Mycolicibacterium]|uniref:hypothetical protein n=1 Tax=unclassified Mycolicibacterium TaxID=2636767 RepID=UPI001EE49ACA|nr:MULTISPECIES: hypothetical protein [unclassified Mycolicibacterium]
MSNNPGRARFNTGAGANDVIIGVVGVFSAVCSLDSPQPAARTEAAAMAIAVVAKRIRHSPISALTEPMVDKSRETTKSYSTQKISRNV